MVAKTASSPWRKIKTRKGLVPRAAIRRVVEQIAHEFKPERIYLFGSYAYGKPHRDSDVDLLVVMPTRNELYQGAKIHCLADPPFAFDVIVRKPQDMEWRLREGDWFLREIVTKGILCYENPHPRVDQKGRGRHARRATTHPR